MARQTINVGTSPNARDGDPIRSAFQKVNANFTELYNTTGADIQIPVQTGNNGKFLTTDGTNLSWASVSKYVSSTTAPALTEGAMWFNSDEGRLYLNYNNAWVDSNPTEIDPNAIRFNNLNQIELPEGGDIVDFNGNSVLGGGISSTNELVNGVHTVSLSSAGLTAFPAISNESLFIQASELGSANASIGISAKNSVIVTANILDTAKQWTFGTEGKLTLPAGTTYEYLSVPLTGHGDGLAVLDFALVTDGVDAQWIAASPNPEGVGYSVGDTFTFDEDFLGIPGASTTIEVLTIGPGGSIVEIGFSPAPLYPADIYRDSPINLQVGPESNRWTFGHTGKLTTPGDIQLGADSYLRFPDSSFQGTAFVGDASRLYGNVDEDVEVTVRHRPAVSANCHIAVGDEFVADTEFNDDITVVQVGWTVDVGGTEYTVTSIDPAPPAWQYRITASGATFVQGTTYTFTNPTATLKTWTFNQQTATLIAPGGAILSSETAVVGEGDTYRDFSIELLNQVGDNEYRWTFNNTAGGLTFPDNTTQTTAWTGSVSSLVNGANTVSLDNGGLDLTFTSGEKIRTIFGGGIELYRSGDNTIGISTSGAEIKTFATGGAKHTWTFGTNGQLTLPADGVINSDDSLHVYVFDSNVATLESTYNQKVIELDAAFAAESWTGAGYPAGPTSAHALAIAKALNPLIPDAWITISSQLETAYDAWQAALNGKHWTFGTDGALTLPSGGAIDGNFINGQWLDTWLTAPLGATKTAGVRDYYGKTVAFAKEDSFVIESNRAISPKVWTFSESGILTLPSSSYLETTDTNLKVGSQGTVTIRSNAATVEGTNSWVFGTTGRTTFPNGTVPAHSYGAAGDKEGMVVFSDPYIYYCKQDYVDDLTDIWVRVAWTGTNW